MNWIKSWWFLTLVILGIAAGSLWLAIASSMPPTASLAVPPEPLPPAHGLSYQGRKGDYDYYSIQLEQRRQDFAVRAELSQRQEVFPYTEDASQWRQAKASEVLTEQRAVVPNVVHPHGVD